MRWIKSHDTAEKIRHTAASFQGHAARFRGGLDEETFQPLPAYLLKLHQSLKHAFDPAGILNPGRMYKDF